MQNRRLRAIFLSESVAAPRERERERKGLYIERAMHDYA